MTPVYVQAPALTRRAGKTAPTMRDLPSSVGARRPYQLESLDGGSGRCNRCEAATGTVGELIMLALRKRYMILLGAVLACLPAAALGTDSAVAAPADFYNDPALNSMASRVAEQVQQHLQGLGEFGGVRITSGGIEVSVVGAPSTGLTAAVSSARAVESGTTVPVVYRRVSSSYSELERTVALIDGDFRELGRLGVRLASWGPDLTSNTVLVRLTTYSPASAEILRARYGSRITVDPGDNPGSGAGRTADSTPWWGGDLIARGTHYCTSWFSATKSGRAVNLTAGHCGSGTWKNGGVTQGTTSDLNFQYGGSVDAQVYPVSSNAGSVWADPSISARRVTSVTSSQLVGTLVCTDGASDREVCNVRINQTGVSTSEGGVTLIQHQVFAGQTQGKAAFSPGDSGGPVYSVDSSGNAKAYGMVIAWQNSSYSQGFYTPVSSVDSVMGVSVKLG